MILSSVTGIIALGFACGLLVGIATALLLRRLRVSKRTALQFTTKFMYSGNLKQTNLLDAIQFLELGRREGVLHIYAGRRKGYLTFVIGQIVDAFFRDTIGKEAVFQMLELDYGDFSFESKVINQPRVITESMMDIALEWDARRYGGAFGGEGEEVGGEQQPTEAAPEGEMVTDAAPAVPMQEPLPDGPAPGEAMNEGAGFSPEAPNNRSEEA
jgi:hypothetical protein